MAAWLVAGVICAVTVEIYFSKPSKGPHLHVTPGLIFVDLSMLGLSMWLTYEWYRRRKRK